MTGAKAIATDLSATEVGVRVQCGIQVSRIVAKDLLLAGDVGVTLDADVHGVGGGIVVQPDVLDIDAGNQLVGAAAVGSGDHARARSPL